MKKNNIFIFHPYPNEYGGTDRSIIKLINNLKNSKINYISLRPVKYKKILKKNISYFIIEKKKSIFSIFDIIKILKTNLKSNYKNIFISNQNYANIVAIIVKFFFNKFKLILIERNHLDELKNYFNLIDYFKKKFLILLIKILYKKSDAIIGVSKKLSYDLSRLVNKEIITIYNPASDFSSIKNIKPKKYKKKIGLNILSVGHLTYQKDYSTTFKALKILKKKNIRFFYNLIGNGFLSNNLKLQVKYLGLEDYVKFHENVKNPINFYKNSDLFILSSIYEGMGNVVVESIYHGCPVIVSKCNSGPNEIIKNGLYGDNFNVGNYKQLANKIINYYKNTQILKDKTQKGKKNLYPFSIKKNISDFNLVLKKI